MSGCGAVAAPTQWAPGGAGSSTLNEAERLEYLSSTVSASRLGCWATCRLKFYFRYVLKLVTPPSPALHIGSVVHGVLQRWSLARWRHEDCGLEFLQAEYQRQWTERQQDTVIPWNDNEEKERSSAWNTLQHYLGNSPIPANEQPEAVEVRAEADLSRHGLPTLVGFMDLVRPGGVIVDFKNAGKTPKTEQVLHLHEAQLSCYGVLYRDATDHREGGFELHHLVRTKTPKVIVTEAPSMTDAQQSRLFRSIESYLNGVERQDFVPSPGFGCAACEYFDQCRRWSP
jgi:CRISPR/Cas system-associated exonuclease Cas4 (RecB family)